MADTHFGGTLEEGRLLLEAIRHQCEDPAADNEGDHCKYGAAGEVLSSCAAHKALREDQRFLNGLVAMRRISAILIAREFEL